MGRNIFRVSKIWIHDPRKSYTLLIIIFLKNFRVLWNLGKMDMNLLFFAMIRNILIDP